MRVRDARFLLALAVLLLTALTVWSLRTLGRYQPFADLTRPTGNGLDQISLRLSDAIVTGRSHGRRQWRVGARVLTLSRDRQQVTAHGIHDGVLYDAQDRPAASLSAARATYQSAGMLGSSSGGSLRVDGGVRATLQRAGGVTLSTDSLVWDSFRSAVQCAGRVTATFLKGAGTATGNNVQVDVRTGDMTLHHLHGTFRVPDSVL